MVFFQTIYELKKWMGSYKWLHLKIENFELFVNYENKLFLIFQICETCAIFYYKKGEFTQF